jgi:hypothetical protein
MVQMSNHDKLHHQEEAGHGGALKIQTNDMLQIPAIGLVK